MESNHLPLADYRRFVVSDVRPYLSQCSPVELQGALLLRDGGAQPLTGPGGWALSLIVGLLRIGPLMADFVEDFLVRAPRAPRDFASGYVQIGGHPLVGPYAQLIRVDGRGWRSRRFRLPGRGLRTEWGVGQ